MAKKPIAQDVKKIVNEDKQIIGKTYFLPKQAVDLSEQNNLLDFNKIAFGTDQKYNNAPMNVPVGFATQNPYNSAINWFCLQNPTSSQCSSYDLLDTKSIWTNLQDCLSGNNYVYCAIDKVCGNDNCRGPCNVNYDDCKYLDGNFRCILNPKKYVQETRWYESPVFIGIVIAVVIVLIVIGIIVLHYIHKSRETQ